MTQSTNLHGAPIVNIGAKPEPPALGRPDLQKAAVLDLGSNTAKLVTYSLNSGNRFERYRNASVVTKLGDELPQTGFLGDAAMFRALTALRQFREMIDLEGIEHVLPIATSAVREAANRADFLQRVRDETGFAFRVLSGQEEALYSYFGAARSLCKPSILFFDLGGGSLEIVHAQNFEVKKVMSLPLGALRLTQMYADRPDKSFTARGIKHLQERILDLIPRRSELGITPDTVMIGVGGTLRNIAKFHQHRTDYPLVKLHNYSMRHAEISNISSVLLGMSPRQIAKIERINAGRAETIMAGSCVVNLMMEQLEFESIVTSAHALREGVLGVSLEFYQEYVLGGKIATGQLENSIRTASTLMQLPESLEVILEMLSFDESMRGILRHAMSMVPRTHSFGDSGHLVSILDDDSLQSHREQVISALSVALYRKKIIATKFFKNFESLLQPHDKKLAKKISYILALDEMLSRSGANVAATGGKLVVTTMEVFPDILFDDLMQKICAVFDTKLEYSLRRV